MELIKAINKANGIAGRAANNNQFKGVKAGNYFLSIQGSNGHYSHPREVLPAHHYIQMELAILDKNKEFFNVNKSSVIRSFGRYNELVERRDGPPSKITIFGYVGINLLNDLYLYLKNNKS